MYTRFICLLYILLFLFCSVSCIAQNWDINVLKEINPSVPNNAVWRVVSSSVAPVIIVLPVGLYLFSYFKHHAVGQKNALHMAAGISAAMVLTQVIKYTINRNRPFVTYPFTIFPFDNTETGLSFPSQHTSFAFATAVILSIRYKKWYLVAPAFTWATMVGYSRLYLGQHYPSDVMMGAMVGTGGAFLAEWLNKKIGHKNP
ncbi:MAG: phosphatase PAP2 family protein [Sediminibacterium sp.]